MFAAKDRAPHDRPASCRLVAFTAPAATSRNLRQESQMRPFVFNGLRTLFSAQKLHHPYFQSLPHSLLQEQNITTVFSVASALLLRSFARVQYSTSLFSNACALFWKSTGGGGTPNFRSFNSPRFSALQIAPCALSEESHHQRGNARLHLRQSQPCPPDRPQPATPQVAK